MPWLTREWMEQGVFCKDSFQSLALRTCTLNYRDTRIAFRKHAIKPSSVWRGNIAFLCWQQTAFAMPHQQSVTLPMCLPVSRTNVGSTQPVVCFPEILIVTSVVQKRWLASSLTFQRQW